MRNKKGQFAKGNISWSKLHPEKMIAWNKGIKGICKPNKTSFKKGLAPWNKGKKTGLHPKNVFQKGIMPWNKGKKLPQFSGKNACHWKGGIITTNGYVFVHMPNHPFCDGRGYVRRSHLIMEKTLGRYLTLKENIHHKGIHFPIKSFRNKKDDSSENLRLFPNNSEHIKFHHKIGTYRK